ncbi:MAG: DPP IV N-terminal domain-containing protein [Pseudomonadota bacterium]
MGFAVAIASVILARPVCAETPLAETSPVEICRFDPAQARALMDAVPFKSSGDIDVVFSPDAASFAYIKGGDIRIGRTATGSILATVTTASFAKALGVAPEDLSIDSIDRRWRAKISSGERSFVIALDNLEDADEIAPTAKPRLVRQMFPMANYDRREVVSPDGQWLASLDGSDVAYREADSEKKTVLTSENEVGRDWFLGNDIWEDSDTIWSPDSQKFIVRLHDSSAVPPIALLDYLGKREMNSAFAYWARAGDPLPSTQLAVVDTSSGSLTPIGAASGADRHLFFVEWSEDRTSILALRYTRDLRTQEALSIDVATGRERIIFSRTVQDGWTKWPSGPRTIRHLPEDHFLLRSDHEGFFQYYVLDKDGAVVRSLTQGKVDVGDVIGFDHGARLMYFLSPINASRPYDQIPHRVSLDGGPSERLSDHEGIHKAVLSPDGQYIVTTYSSETQARSTELISSAGGVIATLAAGKTPPHLNGTPLPERITVKTATNGIDMYGLILKPAGFDPSKSYPVILRVYGGMQIRMPRDGFWPEGLGWPGSEYYSMLNYLASSGFVVVMVSPPGTTGRGKEYNLANYGNWPGDLPVHYAAGLADLAQSRPWMDLNRVGIDGNSWGGYTALYSALETPDIYRSVSISVPETDLLDHVHWIEWQLGTPEQNPQVYANGGLHKRIGELRSNLLITAGTSDVNVPISNTMKLLDGLADAGKPYDLALFPGTNHPHQGRGDRYAYAAEKIRAFHTRHLMKGACE